MSASERAYAAADTWRALAEAAMDTLTGAGRTAQALTANNAGEAVDAFDRGWRALAEREGDGALPRLVDVCLDLACRCDEYAARLSTAPE